MKKVIRIRGREFTAKAGNKFIAFKALKLDGTWIDCRFRKEVQGVPTNAGVYEVTTDSTNCNISHGDFGDVLWVQKVEKFETYIPEDKVAEMF